MRVRDENEDVIQTYKKYIRHLVHEYINLNNGISMGESP